MALLLLFNSLERNFLFLTSIFSDTYKFVVLLVLHFQTSLSCRNETPSNSFFNLTSSLKGLISQICFQIHGLCPESLDSIRALWQDDVEEEISDELWEKILNRIHSSSICGRHSLIQCKVVHVVYFTKARLARIYEGVSPACDKCCQSPANLIHIFWLFPSLHNYWTNIFETLSFISGERIEPNALTALFGICPSVLSNF